MRKINLVWLMVLGLSVAFVACNNNEVSPGDDSELFDFLFLATTNDSTGTHTRGKCNLTAVDVSSLSATITSYVTTNYPGASIEKAGTTTDGSFVLQILKADGTKAGLVFNAAGAFVKEHKGKGLKGTEVAVADLPAAITSYISATYAGSSVEKAMKSEDGKFGVLVKKADETKVLLGFDADGKFIAELSLKDGHGGKKGGKGKRK